MSRADKPMGRAEWRLVRLAAAYVSDPDQSASRGEVLVALMGEVLERVDRTVAVEVTAIAFAADDLVTAPRPGPTWENRYRLARAVHNFFMRGIVADQAADRAGQEERDVA